MGRDQLLQYEENSIGLHYWFDDHSHTMDAFVHNKCEYQFLCIMKEVAASFNIDIIIETEPLEYGGIRNWLRFTSLSKEQIGAIKIALIIALATNILITPISKTVDKTYDKTIEYIFKDKELDQLTKDKLTLEIENLKQKNEGLAIDNKIKRQKSNFYEALENYPKVKRISFVSPIASYIKLSELSVNRDQFKDFILVSDDLDPVIIEDAIIEIISPVLKNGNFKWMGLFNGSVVHFNMQSNEFKTLIQSGKIEFKNGTTIICLLNIRKKIDNEGNETIVGYDVLRVNSYFDNDKPIETPEGKRSRMKKEADQKQHGLFESFDINSSE